MTSDEIRLIRSGGVICKSDAGLYAGNSHRSAVKFLSLYGSSQQVRAIFALLVEGRDVQVVSVDNGEEDAFSISKEWQEGLRLKTYPIGYGKRHGLIFTEGLGREVILWVSHEEKERVLLSALSKRRIPFDREWLSELEKVLLDEGHLIEIQGWGGFGGYLCNWEDDGICDLIVKRILPIYRKNRRKKWSSGSSLKSMEQGLLLK
jgi:hypothetical protein